ncbi:MAG: YceI family protein [Flavobacteriaceae bacterium]|nr:YceI family protein [Flavobacteriaceae bacterium]
MKRITLLLLLIGLGLNAQDKYLTKSGSITFEASVPSFEEVKATNNSVTAILNKDNGEFAALALIKAFRFKNALMEEHFNENYAESDDFPKATFKGVLNKESNSIDGELTFHGITKKLKDIEIKLKSPETNTIIMQGIFTVLVSDFDIKIPKIVSNKLSEKVNVNFEFVLIKKQ